MVNTKYLVPAVGFALIIVYMSSIPGRSIPGSGSLTGKIISNLAHLPEYALLTILWLKAFKREFKNRLAPGNILFLFGLFIFAILDEVHQSFVPGRTASRYDIGLDLVGIIFGFYLLIYTSALRCHQVR